MSASRVAESIRVAFRVNLSVSGSSRLVGLTVIPEQRLDVFAKTVAITRRDACISPCQKKLTAAARLPLRHVHTARVDEGKSMNVDNVMNHSQVVMNGLCAVYPRIVPV